MGQVTVTVNGRAYQIACEDGKERHVEQLAAYVEARVSELAQDVGQVGEARLLLLASLIAADELAEARAAIKDGASTADGLKRMARIEDAAARAIDVMAQRIDAVAARLEGH